MLSLEQKLYQLIINRLDGDKLSSIAYRERAFEFVKKGIGGFILFGGKKDEVKSFIAELQSISETPLFIASDIERGAGQQVNGATRFPCQMAIAAAINRENPDDVKVLEDAISAIADEARDIGINMPLIPVLDVNRNPDNPIICTRAFSDDPEEVSWYGNMYIRTLEAAGRISCAKHFPGHGDTSMDSHIELPVIHKSRQELTDVDLFPFREAVKAGVSSIMIAHLSVPAFDALPATLSEKVITDLLRKELGYEGLVLTDALNMSALEEIEDVPAQCINAGVDILLHPVNADAVVEELKEAMSAGEVAEGKIDAAVDRILNFKKKITPLCPPLPNYEKHAELSLAISDKAITLVKDTPGLLPVK
ncbi:MAG: beta-glucosidase, partial [Nitrospirae bacterium]|nr:beta-glucosidase [Nitrospirota bacterium]